jgi:hypothetical protein
MAGTSLDEPGRDEERLPDLRPRRSVPPHPIQTIGQALVAIRQKAKPAGRAARAVAAPKAHSMTSSAMARIPSGMVIPIALAVCKLMMNSNLVGSTTGRSAGFSPFKTRPV